MILIDEKEDPNLKREGNNLHYDLYISIPDAVLGSIKKLSGWGQGKKSSFEPGIQSGKILRLKNKGLKSLNGQQEIYWFMSMYGLQKQ